MQDIHYSMIDIILIMITLECILIYGLVVIARVLPTPSRACRYLMGLLFIVIGLDALAILFVWHTELSALLAPASWLAIAFTSFAFTAKGPLLLLLVQALVTPQFKLRPVHILHLSTFFITLTVAFTNNLDIARITYTVDSELPNLGTNIWWTLIRLSPCIYALAAIHTLRKMTALYDSYYTNNEYQYSYWIQVLVWGFFSQWALNFAVHIAGINIPIEIADPLGISNNIAILILINALLFYSFKVMRTLSPLHLQTPEDLTANPFAPQSTAADHATPALIKALQPHPINTGAQSNKDYLPSQKMPANNRRQHEALRAVVSGIDDKQLYLHQTLNVERFAREIELPAKDVSRLINTYFDCSFSEFINAFRTYEAERLLSSRDHADAMIIDLITLAGFNSKSAFHRFFKRFTGLSPREYRKLHTPR